MPKEDCILRVRISWWFLYIYLPGLKIYCTLTGREPDIDKIEYYLNKAISLRKVN